LEGESCGLLGYSGQGFSYEPVYSERSDGRIGLRCLTKVSHNLRLRSVE